MDLGDIALLFCSPQILGFSHFTVSLLIGSGEKSAHVGLTDQPHKFFRRLTSVQYNPQNLGLQHDSMASLFYQYQEFIII